MSAPIIAVAAGLLIAVLGTYGSLTGSVERLAVSIAGNANYEIVYQSLAEGGKIVPIGKI